MLLPVLEPLEEVTAGYLVQVLGGEYDGRLVVVRRPLPPGARSVYRDLAGHPRDTASERATALLESLLDDRQLRQWRSNRQFWVDTSAGAVRLGKLYELTHRPHDGGADRTLCVVPRGHRQLPVADVWANLLLMLTHDPDRFFRVAVVRQPATVRRRS